jgi:crossover junction endodeoxyribonuclease RusA
MTENSSIVLVLPPPVSANRYWVPINVKARSDSKTGKTRQIFVPSKEAEAFKKAVVWIAKAAGIRKPIDARVHVHIALYPQRPKDYLARIRKFGEDWHYDTQCIDLDNARKCLNDSLKGVVIVDDSRKYIVSDSGEIMEPDGEARMVVTITEKAAKRVQPALFDSVA